MEEIVLKITADTSQAKQAIDSLADSAKGIEGSPGFIGFQEQIKGISDSSGQATQDVQDVANTINFAGKISIDANVKIEKVGKAVSKAGDQAKKSSGGFKQLLSALGRIAMYRFLRTVIKEITEAFKEGLNNAYMFSKGIGGDLATALDGLSTKSLTMKNQLGAAFGQLLQNIMPIILTIVGLVTRLADAITQLFAGLGGNSTYLKAIDTQKEFAESTKSATGHAKELRRTLMGFDVINRLNDNNSGGGGSGDNTPDYSKMFEVTEVDSKIKEFTDKIRGIVADSGIVEAWENFRSALMDSGILEFIGKIAEALVLGSVETSLATITDLLNFLTALLKGDFYDAVNQLKNLLVDLVLGPLVPIADIIDAIFGTDIGGWLRGVIEEIKSFDLAAWLEETLAKIGEFFESVGTWFTQTWEDIKEIASEIGKWFDEKVFTPIATFCQDAMNAVVGFVEDAINGVIRVINWFIRQINEVLGLINDAFGSSLKIGEVKKISLRNSYATGGFPEDGLFFANHSELVGQFSNGRTAVANNDQIIAGIRQGVYEAMVSANGTNNNTQSAEINIDGITLARALFKYNNQVSNEHGTSLVIA